MRKAGAAALACALIAGCGGSAAQTTSAGSPAPAKTSTTASAAVATTPTTGSQSPTVATALSRPQPPASACPSGAGALPQTTELPSASTACFHELMQSLWRGISTGSAAAAMPAFFPEPAYAQVKAIADPQADWMSRLVGYYRLDVMSAHQLLGGPARLVGVDVPSGYAHWVGPGACYNRLGYYEVPNSRVVYSQSGQLRSFGIASMISWRGVWYVVHLGAVVRSVDSGVVDDPAFGAGVAAPSSTC